MIPAKVATPSVPASRVSPNGPLIVPFSKIFAPNATPLVVSSETDPARTVGEEKVITSPVVVMSPEVLIREPAVSVTAPSATMSPAAPTSRFVKALRLTTPPAVVVTEAAANPMFPVVTFNPVTVL